MKVSVIIPVYNAAAYLAECLDSLLAQTLRDFGVICVDDGSTDDSLARLRSYQTNFEQKGIVFKIIEEPNAGAGAARNRGLAEAKGDYLSFVDPDDRCAPGMLEKALHAAQTADADIVIFRHEVFDSTSGQMGGARPFPLTLRRQLAGRSVFAPRELSAYLLSAAGHSVWNKLFRRDFIAAQNLRFQTLRRTNDLYFVLVALMTAGRIAFLDEVLYFYRKGIASTTTQDRLTGSCFVAYAAVKDFIAHHAELNVFSDDFTRKIDESFRTEVLAMQDTSVRRALYPQIRKAYLDLVPQGDIADIDAVVQEGPLKHLLWMPVRLLRDLVAAHRLHAAGTFDAEAYLDAYPDVRLYGKNPYWHYMRHGRIEGRRAL